MDLYNYNKMAELKEQLKSNDIAYLGTLSMNEIDKATNKKIQNTYDIYVSIEENNTGFIYKFYNNDSKLLAIKDNNNGILPTEEFLHILNKDDLKQLSDFIYSQENSFNQINQDLEKISFTTGISKEEILAVSETDAFYRNSKETSENDEKIHLKDDKNDKENNKNTKTSQEQDSKSKAKIEALEKQSTDLNQKVSETETLGDILGIHEGGKLVAVYSDSIENGTKNNTRFTFLLKDADGNYSEIPNIEQAGGINPNTDVAQSNENGDNVKKDDVNSIYRIKGPGNIEYLLTANIGPYGTIELGIGQRDKTQGIDESDLVTTPLKTSSTYYTTRQTREAINSSRHGTYQSTKRSNESGKHNDKCEITKDNVDGKEDTGHQHHAETDNYGKIADEILENNSIIPEVYNRNDLIVALKNVHKENPNLSDERLTTLVTEIMEYHAKDEITFGHMFGSRSHETE